MHQSHVSLSYAGPRNVHSFGDIYQLPSVQNDVEDALSADNRGSGEDRNLQSAQQPTPVVAAAVAVVFALPEHGLPY